MIELMGAGENFISDATTLRRLPCKLASLATEMENAGAGCTCRLNNFPFVAVLGLSDAAGEAPRIISKPHCTSSAAIAICYLNN
jgi:nucleoside phosphorylase